jgi:hypothetical protein
MSEVEMADKVDAPIDDRDVCQKQDAVKGFTSLPIYLLMGLFAIGGIACIVVGGVVKFETAVDKSQWIKLKVLTQTSDGLLMTLENETAPAGMGYGGVTNKTWEQRTIVNVPYDCLFVSLGCAMLSLSAMCFFANSTLSRAQGSKKMAELSGIIQQGAKNFMLTEAKCE